eukprot:1089651-Pyramimonas_sp.AAC.1
MGPTCSPRAQGETRAFVGAQLDAAPSAPPTARTQRCTRWTLELWKDTRCIPTVPPRGPARARAGARWGATWTNASS